MSYLGFLSNLNLCKLGFWNYANKLLDFMQISLILNILSNFGLYTGHIVFKKLINWSTDRLLAKTVWDLRDPTPCLRTNFSPFPKTVDDETLKQLCSIIRSIRSLDNTMQAMNGHSSTKSLEEQIDQWLEWDQVGCLQRTYLNDLDLDLEYSSSGVKHSCIHHYTYRWSLNLKKYTGK